MSIRHTVICDYCRLEVPAKYNGEHYIGPHGWSELIPCETGAIRHVCADCTPNGRNKYVEAMAALKWSLTGNNGLSSNQLIATYFGFKQRPYAPADKGDRGRCIEALRAVPGAIQALEQLAAKDPAWAEQLPLILNEMKEIQ